LTVCFDPGRGGIRALAVNDVPPVEIAAGEHPLGELGLYETGRYPMDYGEELRAWHAAFTGARRFLEPAEQAVRSFSGERRAVSFHYRFGHSAVTQEFLIEPDAEFVEATVSGEWGEVEQYLKIHFVLPAAEEVVAFADLPYGFTERLPEKQEYSMQYLCGMRDARRGLVVVNNGRYGCLWDGARLSLSVIRCATYPAGRSDQGPFAVRYRVGLADVTAPDWRLRAFRAGYELDVPPCSYAPEYTRADRPAMWSPLDEPLDGVLGTCLKPAHSGPAAVLRLFNPAPASRTQRVVFRDDVKLTAVDLLEEPCEQDVREADRAAEFALRPFGLATLRVSPRTPADSCWSARAAPSSGAA
jgi:alpha-mannosidase